MELPTKLADIEVTVDELDPVLEEAVKKYDMDYIPYPVKLIYRNLDVSQLRGQFHAFVEIKESVQFVILLIQC